MLESLIENFGKEEQLKYILLVSLCLASILTSLLLISLLKRTAKFLSSLQIIQVTKELFAPYKIIATFVVSLAIAEILILLSYFSSFYWLEILVSLSLGITTSVLLIKVSQQFFEVYLLDFAISKGRKLNGELLLVSRLLANLLIVVAITIVFAQTHHINIFGLAASLGIVGLALAASAQKTLEQFLAGVILFLDRPFIVDDYIGLPDGTFGRVESIGIRCTRIRTSGKGTLVIIPNNSLTESSIENFSGAKKVISVISLIFYRTLPDEEKALIRQVILDGTKDIFGIDVRNTSVDFLSPQNRDMKSITHAKVSFFILGSGEVSMDFRRQLLDLAQQNINQKLKDYGIDFDLQEQNANIDSPITI